MGTHTCDFILVKKIEFWAVHPSISGLKNP